MGFAEGDIVRTGSAFTVMALLLELNMYGFVVPVSVTTTLYVNAPDAPLLNEQTPVDMPVQEAMAAPLVTL